jgi:SAM-dependent methyltransferase
MNFPITRHLQRYEYISELGYVRDRVVADFGCGCGFGAYILTSNAKFVYGVDYRTVATQIAGINGSAHKDRFFFVHGSLFDFEKKVDVCVLVEVFEHVEDPEYLMQHVSSIGEFAFITTPLAEVTGKTRNPDHIAEYSSKDFDTIVSRHFDILDKVYQHSDMTITKEAVSKGDSFTTEHVVQMVWCRRKDGR